MLDFQSLYPSLIIAYNLCYTTCIGNIEEKFSAGGKKRLGVQNEWDVDLDEFCCEKSGSSEKIFIAPNKVGFVKRTVREGLLPSMIHEFFLTRLHLKERMKKYAHNESLKHIYDLLASRQKSLKLFMCVIFGYTGATYSGRMPLGDLADAIVSTAKYILN